MECKKIVPGMIFRDDNNNAFQIVTVAIHESTSKELVIFQALFGEFKVYAREKNEFFCEMNKNDGLKEKTNDLAEEKELTINSDLLAFLNADDYKEKIDILSGAKNRIDDKVIESMAVSLDYVIPEGDFDEKYNSLIQVLRTRQKYEIKRR